MKQHAKLFLSCDPHRGPVYGMDDGHQWDGWYAANDSTIFTFVSEYINTTGDVAFLDEKVGDKTVLEHLDTLATNWQKLQRDKSVMLADYGDNQNLLECAPAYVHRVPSFNAANVWMMRTVADMQEQRGNTARAAELRDWADQIAQAVLGMYKPGDGVWYALHRDGERVELRHCYDFVCIGRFMPDDLTPQMKQEMVAFVERELLTDQLDAGDVAARQGRGAIRSSRPWADGRLRRLAGTHRRDACACWAPGNPQSSSCAARRPRWTRACMAKRASSTARTAASAMRRSASPCAVPACAKASAAGRLPK